MDKQNKKALITGQDDSFLKKVIKEITGFQEELIENTDKPNGPTGKYPTVFLLQRV